MNVITWDNMIMRYRIELVLGLHETVEIQSATKERYVLVRDGLVTIVDNTVGTVKPIWTLSDLRSIVSWNNV